MNKKFYAYHRPQKNIYNSFSLVAIGASTGGLEAATTLFSNVPANTGMTFLYLQHFDQTKKTNIVSSLEQVTGMPVLQAIDGMPVLPDHIYIIPPGKETTIAHDRFVIIMLREKPLHRLPVDRLFAALAEVYTSHLIGIVLSGVTRDGTVGLQAIKAAGGSTMVQDESALFNNMPSSAIIANVADKVLSPQQIAAALEQISREQSASQFPVIKTAGAGKKQEPSSPKSDATLLAINRELQRTNKQLTEAYEKARKAVEEQTRRMQQQTNELQQVNLEWQRTQNDLQQFAYVASHDLQEPLRKIITYSDRLQQRYNELLPDTGRNYIEKIISSALRMTRLLDDLLSFSKIANEREIFSLTNLTDIVDRVLNSLQDSIQQKQADISYWGLPVIEAVPHQMELLFYHLITNALKFAHSHQSPVITITSGKLHPDQLQQFDKLNRSLSYYDIIVRDNGIGFNPDFAKQIFVIFQRLNDKREFPGTGIGLALCHKITGNHHGEIYAESKEGEGSAFHIILPVRQP